MAPDNPVRITPKLPRLERHRDIMGALLLITFGTLFLMNNFNLLPWTIWSLMWQFWPVLLILTGIQVLFGRTLIGEIVVFFLGVVIIGYIVGNLVALENRPFRSWWYQYFTPQAFIFRNHLRFPRFEMGVPDSL